jgi:hypothetical protein
MTFRMCQKRFPEFYREKKHRIICLLQVGLGALRVYVESDDSVQETPVLVVVRHEKGVLSWQLPLLLQVTGDSSPRCGAS